MDRFSKVNTLSDGYRVIGTIFALLRNYRPMFLFGWVGTALILSTILLATPVVIEYLRAGMVPGFATFILSYTLAICGPLSIVCGLILASTKRYGDEIFEILMARDCHA